jgi:uracil-DNA glycosylase
MLLEQIRAVDPEVVILLGRVPAKTLEGEPVLRDRRMLVTAHPAAAMRFPRSGRRFRRDLRRVARLLGGRRT